MSLTTIPQYSSLPEDHLFIPRHLARHDVGVGGWDEWASGCICGFYTKGVEGKWYIPSKASAEKIWNDHLQQATGRDIVQIPEEGDHEVPDNPFGQPCPPNPFIGRELEALDEIIAVAHKDHVEKGYILPEFTRVGIPILLAVAIRDKVKSLAG